MNDMIAAIFDMDGVLVDTYHAHFRSWRELAESEGIELTEADFSASFGRTSREIIAHHWKLEGGAGERVDELDRRKEAAFRRLLEEDFPAMPGAVELLGALRASGFRLAVGSSAPPENVEAVVSRLGIGDLLGAVVTGADVVRGKPDPQVFLLAAERLGVAPGQCVVVEDAPPGVKAAKTAGMAAVGMASTGRTAQELAEADLVVGSLSELSPAGLRELIENRRREK